MRKPVAIAIVLSTLALVAAGCGGDDDETTTAATTPTGLTGLTGATGSTGAAGNISQIEQNLEDAGFTVEPGDPASLTVTLPTGNIEAEEKLDVTGGTLTSAGFVTEYADDTDAEAVFDQYQSEDILQTERQGTIVFSASTEDDLDLLVDAAKGG